MREATGRINIAIADDHYIFLEGLTATIDSFEDCSVIMKADSGAGLLASFEQATQLPDICIFDISLALSEGYDTLKTIKQKWPKIKMLIISAFANEISIMRSIKVGVNGFLLRTSEPEDIHKAILSIHKDGYYYSEFIPREFLEKDRDSVLLQLTYPEMEYLSLCCSEMSYKAIADCMNISIHTVEGYKRSLFKKLHTNSRIGLVLFALNMGMAPVYKK